MARQDSGRASYPGCEVVTAVSDAAPRRRLLQAPERPVAAVLGGIALIGLAVRVWAATHPVVTPGPDADTYASLARAMFEHHSYGVPGQTHTSDWSPGAPLL